MLCRYDTLAVRDFLSYAVSSSDLAVNLYQCLLIVDAMCYVCI